MEVQALRCAGIDIGKRDVKVCVRRDGPGPRDRARKVRTFATRTGGLLLMRDWLVAEGVTRVGMESTGVYWKPVFYLLEDVIGECWLINPQHIKKVPGRKSDVSDAVWIADVVAHGLVRPSFVPPPPIRALRDLTRYRAALVHERTRETLRLHALLEDAGIKLAGVASNVLGVSGRAMLAGLIGGQRDPVVLADRARGRMRSKLPALREALTGHFSDHHALLAQLMLDRIDTIDASIARLNTQIDVEISPFREAVTLLQTIPGVGRRTAEVIVSETGADMSRFPTPADLSSWAGMCPGNNESAGKHFSGRTRNGDSWLRGALGEAAAAAAHTHGTYLAARYHRVARRRGNKRALVAVGRSILEASWQVMTKKVPYADLGPDHFLTLVNKKRRTQRLVDELSRLGYHVTLTEAA